MPEPSPNLKQHYYVDSASNYRHFTVLVMMSMPAREMCNRRYACMQPTSGRRTADTQGRIKNGQQRTLNLTRCRNQNDNNLRQI